MNNPLEWKGLLKWSLQYHDGTSSTEEAPMSDEKKKFLENVMASLVVDESKRIVEIIDTLLDGVGGALEQDSDQVEEIFDELEDIVCQLDYANFFVKLNGLFAISELLKSESSLMRERALSIVSTVAQNNPEAQAGVHNFQGKAFFIGLIQHFKDVEEDGRAKAACLSALSAVITNFEAAENTFFEENGLGILGTVIAGPQDAGGNIVGRKANFVAKKFFMADNLPADKVRTLADALALPLVNAAGMSDADRREKALEALAALASAMHNVGEAMGEAVLATLREVRQARLAVLRTLAVEDAETESGLWSNITRILDAVSPSAGGGDTGGAADAPADAAQVFMIGPPTENLPQ